MIHAGMGREFPRTFFRLEGFADSVDYRIGTLLALLADFDAEHVLRGEDSRRLWRAVRDVEFLAEPRERAIWRVSLAALATRAEFFARLGARRAGPHVSIGAAALSGSRASRPRRRRAAVRAALAPLGGHATLMRAPDALRARRSTCSSRCARRC